MGKLYEITLDEEHNNMLKNLLADYDGSLNQAISDIIAYYYNNIQHPTIRVERNKMDSYILDGLEMSEKDALLLRQLLLAEKAKAERELSYILYKEEDNSWWYGGSKVQAENACKVQYDSVNMVQRCSNIVKALDELIEQRLSHDA